MPELGSSVSEMQSWSCDVAAPTKEPGQIEGELRLAQAQIVGSLNGLTMGEKMSAWMTRVADEQHLVPSLALHARTRLQRSSERRRACDAAVPTYRIGVRPMTSREIGTK